MIKSGVHPKNQFLELFRAYCASVYAIFYLLFNIMNAHQYEKCICDQLRCYENTENKAKPADYVKAIMHAIPIGYW